MISTDLSIDRARRASHRNKRARDGAQAMSWGMGFSFGFGLGSIISGAHDFYPTDIPGCQGFFDVTRLSSLTSGTTMLASGTSPPVVTLAGTRTSAGALRIEIQSSTTFRWCDDNTGSGSSAGFAGGNSNITIPAGGAAFSFGNGLSATFPSGTYGATQVYQETISDVASQVNGAHKLSQATASKQARILTGSGGIGSQLTLRGDGTDDTYLCSAIDLPQPNVTPVWIWAIAAYDAFSSSDALFSGNSACWVDPATSTTLQQNNGAPGTNKATYAVGTPKRLIVTFLGGSGTDSIQWGSSLATGNTSGTANSTAGFWILSNRDLAGSYVNGRLCAIGVWNVVVSGANLTALETWGASKFGAGLF